ncbi:MAG: sigma-70 family RNA polymerase sigma factor [Bacillota bacterium]|nr:sigma-70 family RNA polymerase sigma factor [Bacillota bacterium]
MPGYSDKELDKLYQKNKEGDLEARGKLVDLNLPLVHAICRRYPAEITEYDDIFQEGCIGLLKSLIYYDPERGTKFSTYAVPYILGEIKSFLRRNGHLLKVSRSYHNQYYQMIKSRDALQQELKRHPRLEELAERLKLPKEEITWLMELQYPVLSLNEDNTGGTLEEKNSFDTETIFNKMILQEKLKSLSPRERQVIVLRFFMEKSQGEVAQILGISQSHVSRLERQVMKGLKENS